MPSVHESIAPGFESSSWYGLCVPAGTPAAITDKVHADVTSVLRTPEMQQRFRDMVVQYTSTTREEFGQFMRVETARWAKVIKDAGIVQQ